jgi:hypothetical protein
MPAVAWRRVFLGRLAEGLTVTQAANEAGVARRTVYQHRADDPDSAHAWDDAWEQGTDTLEAEAWRRARDGTERPIIPASRRALRLRPH